MKKEEGGEKKSERQTGPVSETPSHLTKSQAIRRVIPHPEREEDREKGGREEAIEGPLEIPSLSLPKGILSHSSDADLSKRKKKEKEKKRERGNSVEIG